MDRRDPLRGDDYRAIPRAGLVRDAGGPERLVVMGDLGGRPMRDADGIARSITEVTRQVRAEPGVEQVGEADAFGQRQRPSAAKSPRLLAPRVVGTAHIALGLAVRSSS